MGNIAFSALPRGLAKSRAKAYDERHGRAEACAPASIQNPKSRRSLRRESKIGTKSNVQHPESRRSRRRGIQDRDKVQNPESRIRNLQRRRSFKMAADLIPQNHGAFRKKFPQFRDWLNINGAAFGFSIGEIAAVSTARDDQNTKLIDKQAKDTAALISNEAPGDSGEAGAGARGT